jgi:hypothetical protein
MPVTVAASDEGVSTWVTEVGLVIGGGEAGPASAIPAPRNHDRGYNIFKICDITQLWYHD